MIPITKFVTKTGGPAGPAVKKFMKDIKKQMREVGIAFPIEAQKIAQYASDAMASRVIQQTKRKGSKGFLAAALKDCVRFKTYGKLGFRLDFVSDALPEYWAMINYGGFVSPEFVYGEWSDGKTGKSDYAKRGGQGTGEFTAKKGGSIMTPRRPIKGFHYIAFAYDKTLAYVRKNFTIAKLQRKGMSRK